MTCNHVRVVLQDASERWSFQWCLWHELWVRASLCASSVD